MHGRSWRIGAFLRRVKRGVQTSVPSVHGCAVSRVCNTISALIGGVHAARLPCAGTPHSSPGVCVSFCVLCLCGQLVRAVFVLGALLGSTLIGCRLLRVCVGGC